eukprot:TRINITY_DN41541_c0_g1_i1.p2 TRINITY_DN41541_c0_g1~~TRINITY_DN41541_c0_g1_i1.p2  ORF type:complete len:101 (-),score=4.38 TRINITY_DN41541_c0_g1_i1:2-304(-)
MPVYSSHTARDQLEALEKKRAELAPTVARLERELGVKASTLPKPQSNKRKEQLLARLGPKPGESRDRCVYIVYMSPMCICVCLSLCLTLHSRHCPLDHPI